MISLIIPLIIFSCIKNPSGLVDLKYSKEDLVPLDDSKKILYYKDAAFIELDQINKDNLRKYEQVKLNESNIQSHYEDLIKIYNNSYSVSNSFFENIDKIHIYCTHILYNISASVDTNKLWVERWLNGNQYTGIIGIDSLIEKYDLDISINKRNRYSVTIKSEDPINHVALIQKFQNTGEFRYVEPDAIIGGGNKISMDFMNNFKIYKYSLGWGDCESGCIFHHYWKIKIDNDRIILFEEFGDTLNEYINF